MPIGSWSAFQRIIQGTLATNPKSVLDIGIGFGINGAGVRNWMDLGVQPFRTKLVGIEGFEGYRNPTWGLYDEVKIGDAFEIIDSLESFDLILMTDVIEHFTKEKGVQMLEKCKAKCNKGVIVSTPSVWIEQGAAYGNDYETHKSMWTVQDFVGIGYGIIWDGRLDQYGHMMLIADYIKR